MNDVRSGVMRLPLHLATFGLLGALATIYGGWGAAAVLVAWRSWEEYLDFSDGRDTLAKAVIDFASQVTPAVVMAVVEMI